MTLEKNTTTSIHRKLRVLVAKVGLDGHDRGVKIVTRALRDAGIEVIYLGIHNTPEEIVRSALQEDVDAIGLSIHSAAHMTLFREVMRLLKKNKATGIVVFGGGIVPEPDVKKLKKIGVREIFTPGGPLKDVVSFVTSIALLKPKARPGSHAGDNRAPARSARNRKPGGGAANPSRRPETRSR
jgi:methylmalonyl-CoA mutase cobalamin-binding domain/chain